MVVALQPPDEKSMGLMCIITGTPLNIPANILVLKSEDVLGTAPTRPDKSRFPTSNFTHSVFHSSCLHTQYVGWVERQFHINHNRNQVLRLLIPLPSAEIQVKPNTAPE